MSEEEFEEEKMIKPINKLPDATFDSRAVTQIFEQSHEIMNAVE